MIHAASASSIQLSRPDVLLQPNERNAYPLCVVRDTPDDSTIVCYNIAAPEEATPLLEADLPKGIVLGSNCRHGDRICIIVRVAICADATDAWDVQFGHVNPSIVGVLLVVVGQSADSTID